MKIKKHFSHSNGATVWRLLINNSGFLLIEERDTINKTARFQCYDLLSGKQIIKNLSFAEQFWIGVEGFEDDLIFFHHFVKPDMPWHKDIIAYSVSKNEVIWKNEELVYSFYAAGRLYAFRQLFESAAFFALDPNTGKVSGEYGENSPDILQLKEAAQADKNYSNYIFPRFYKTGSEPFTETMISPEMLPSEGDMEMLYYHTLLLAASHKNDKSRGLYQTLYAVDFDTKKIIYEEVINRKLRSLNFDSFFIFKNFLIVIFDKITVKVYRIES